jgi:hypothetical protein
VKAFKRPCNHQRIHRKYWLKCLDLQTKFISWHFPFQLSSRTGMLCSMHVESVLCQMSTRYHTSLGSAETRLACLLGRFPVSVSPLTLSGSEVGTAPFNKERIKRWRKQVGPLESETNSNEICFSRLSVGGWSIMSKTRNGSPKVKTGFARLHLNEG